MQFEHASATGFTDQFDLAMMGFDNLSANDQTQTRPVCLVIPAHRQMCGEQYLLFVKREAFTPVPYSDHEPVPSGSRPELDPPTLRCVLDCVLHQIGDHLLNAIRVHLNLWQDLGHSQIKPHPPALHFRLQTLKQLREKILHMDATYSQCQCARI